MTVAEIDTMGVMAQSPPPMAPPPRARTAHPRLLHHFRMTLHLTCCWTRDGADDPPRAFVYRYLPKILGGDDDENQLVLAYDLPEWMDYPIDPWEGGGGLWRGR